MCLGTCETAEEAARAYDEAVCLLRGSNTRTIFITHMSLDSPLASRIRNLHNNKKGGITRKREQVVVDASSNTSNSTNTNSSNNDTSDEISLSSEKSQERELFEDGYRPDLSKFMKECSESGLNKSNFSWGFEDMQNYDGFFLDTCGLVENSEFLRMKVEKQISASLYAVNGVQEYMDTFQDS